MDRVGRTLEPGGSAARTDPPSSPADPPVRQEARSSPAIPPPRLSLSAVVPMDTNNSNPTSASDHVFTLQYIQVVVRSHRDPYWLARYPSIHPPWWARST